MFGRIGFFLAVKKIVSEIKRAENVKSKVKRNQKNKSKVRCFEKKFILAVKMKKIKNR